ncbi:MAG: phospho-N-acetylmuramoyl-pentapeptide-transferase [Candidatus Omnitrophica bacterium]|nr:phospho-N-acetylmuramoyl-pentapeptide-transferase [Candidatus Omnitrophota bacterium]
MLYKFLYSLTDFWFGFNIFRYVTVRASLAIFTSLLFSILFGRRIINKLKNFCYPNLLLNFREDKKEKTPTMGGFLILGSLLISVFLWSDLKNTYILLLIFLTITLGFIGFLDDYTKLKYKSHKGVRPLVKIVGQIFVGFIIGFVLVYNYKLNFNTSLYLPFFKNVIIPLGEYFILFTVFIIIATSNAVNLTDGMDGLAIGLVLTVGLAYAIIAYVVSNLNFANYLNIPFVKGAEETTVFSAALVGACLGFLWFNCYPAEIFMGDIGSLPLGGIIGLLAIIVKQELSLIFVGGIFLIEALSVIIQVFSFKKRGKRIFLMTPIHHHFELKGVPEPKVVVRFWIVGIILALFTVITLKIR